MGFGEYVVFYFIRSVNYMCSVKYNSRVHTCGLSFNQAVISKDQMVKNSYHTWLKM